jgi:hypothetical protein
MQKHVNIEMLENIYTQTSSLISFSMLGFNS